MSEMKARMRRGGLAIAVRKPARVLRSILTKP
jgi:hypothetical protein